MTQEKQRIAIAEACGWTEIPWDRLRSVREAREDKQFCRSNANHYCGWLPDYLNDLNAIIQVVKSLPKERILKVLEFLQIIVTDDPENGMNEKALATPQQWSEAFLRTVGRWEE